MLPSIGQAVVRKRALKRLLSGHLWVYKSDVEVRAVEPGLVEVLDPNGKIFGQAFYSPRSQIALRLLARGTQVITKEFIVGRFKDALKRRQQMLPEMDAYRLVHGEGDLLPGLFVERYGRAFVVQSTCAAAELLEPLCVDWLKEQGAELIVINNTTKSRRAEGLELYRRVVLGDEPAVVSFREHGFAYSVDLLGDQKTGSFFDQRDNHGQIGKYAFGKGLDAFTYHGGFALNMSRHCESVQAVDLSVPALERVESNVKAAGVENLTTHKADVMKYLPRLLEEKQSFDTIVLDPPAFASGRESVGRALAAYKKLNRWGLSLLNSGGVMATCSCSGRISFTDFEKSLKRAASDLGLPIQILERRGAGVDHPVLAGMEETEYLKAIFLRRLS